MMIAFEYDLKMLSQSKFTRWAQQGMISHTLEIPEKNTE